MRRALSLLLMLVLLLRALTGTAMGISPVPLHAAPAADASYVAVVDRADHRQGPPAHGLPTPTAVVYPTQPPSAALASAHPGATGVLPPDGLSAWPCASSHTASATATVATTGAMATGHSAQGPLASHDGACVVCAVCHGGVGGAPFSLAPRAERGPTPRPDGKTAFFSAGCAPTLKPPIAPAVG